MLEFLRHLFETQDSSNVSWKFLVWKFHKFPEIFEIFHGTISKVSL